MMKPRVLFVAPGAYPWGGLATWLAYLVPGLRSCGWEATLGLTSGEHHDVPAYRRAHPELDIVAVDHVTGSVEGRIRSILRTVQALRPDVVVGVNIPDTYVAIARLRQQGLPSPRAVMSIHGISLHLSRDAHLFREVLDAVICTNRLACELAMQHGGVPRERVHYAPYGVVVPSQAAASPRNENARLRIAYVGRIEETQKRTSLIAPILEKLQAMGVDAELWIAGGGPDEAALRAALQPWHAQGRVRFLGTLDPQSLASQVYGQADALLVTSYWETGPIVIWEAMAHGLPVVSSRYIGSGLESGLVDEGNCLLFARDDAADAARQLARLTSAPLRDRLRHGGHALVSGRYSQAASIEGWDGVLRRVAAQPVLGAGNIDHAAPSAGRLDRWLGPAVAEDARRLLRRRHRHADPGGEWPHVYSDPTAPDADFWIRARELDGV